MQSERHPGAAAAAGEFGARERKSKVDKRKETEWVWKKVRVFWQGSRFWIKDNWIVHIEYDPIHLWDLYG